MNEAWSRRGIWQRTYEAAHRARLAWWRRRATRVAVPVVSVGNLHWGGTGKTPVVEALAAALRDRGRRVAVISRGYRRSGSGTVIVSRGQGPLVSVARAGDEPFLLASRLPGVGVVVDSDRRRAAEVAIGELEADLLLLDDGFSHLRLARDLDLVVLPTGDPFGGGLLAPGGRLREPLVALRRADAVLVTGAEADFESVEAEVRVTLSQLGVSPRIDTVALESAPVRSATGEPLAAGVPVLAVAGIARAQRFFAAARRCGLDVRGELEFPDHHPYPRRSVARIEQRAAELGVSTVLTTAKDRVKLEGRLATPMVELPLVAQVPDELVDWVCDRVNGVIGKGSR